jgi:predicted metal-dependent peptidase
MTPSGPPSGPPSNTGQTVQTARDRLTRARAWVSLRYPFFAVLALHLPDKPASVKTARTDGRSLEFDPEYVAGLSDDEARGLVLHLVLHAALGHPWRRGARDAGRWDRACDIVVNGLLRKLLVVRLPRGADATDPSLEHLSVEEIYETLPPDLPPPDAGEIADPRSGESQSLESFWQDARAAAASADERPAGLERHYPRAKSGVNWRSQLERYLLRGAQDYLWNPPDRRMMAHDLIYPSLAGDALRVAVAVDTSGSVRPEQIGRFVAEVAAIARSHPQISGLVLYADAAVNEVHDLRRAAPPSVRGGGGTGFEPVFRELERRREVVQVLVYLTDGQPIAWPARPRYPVVWAIPGEPGVEVRPPFGTVLRLSDR